MVTVHHVAGIPIDPPEQYPLTIRGKRKGNNAKPCKCDHCKGEIAVGEQYFRIDEPYGRFCLGCVKFD